MALVYSTRFIQAQALSGSSSFTVPDGHVAVVRDLDAFHPSGAGDAFLFMEGALGQTIWATDTIGSGFAYAQWRGRQVLEATETLLVVATNNWDVTVSGYLLVAP